MTGASTIRLGLLGAGPWGRNYIKTIAGMPHVELSHVFSRRNETERLVPPSCTVVNDWEEVLGLSGLDGVIVATPPHLHAEMARAAIENKLAALIEKPLTLDPVEASSLVAIARERGVFVLVDHIYLFHPAFRLLKGRRVGDPPLGLTSEGGNWGPFRADTPALWDYAPHDVAMCLDLMGTDPVEIQAQRISDPLDPNRTRENVEMRLTFPGGVTARVVVGNLMPQRTRRLTLSFSEARELIWDDEAHEKVVESVTQGNRRRIRPLEYADTPPLVSLVDYFVSSIRNKETDTASLELGARVVGVIAEAWRRSEIAQ